jgi:hypothetical protein
METLNKPLDTNETVECTYKDEILHQSSQPLQLCCYFPISTTTIYKYTTLCDNLKLYIVTKTALARQSWMNKQAYVECIHSVPSDDHLPAVWRRR